MAHNRNDSKKTVELLLIPGMDGFQSNTHELELFNLLKSYGFAEQSGLAHRQLTVDISIARPDAPIFIINSYSRQFPDGPHPLTIPIVHPAKRKIILLCPDKLEQIEDYKYIFARENRNWYANPIVIVIARNELFANEAKKFGYDSIRMPDYQNLISNGEVKDKILLEFLMHLNAVFNEEESVQEVFEPLSYQNLIRQQVLIVTECVIRHANISDIPRLVMEYLMFLNLINPKTLQIPYELSPDLQEFVITPSYWQSLVGYTTNDMIEKLFYEIWDHWKNIERVKKYIIVNLSRLSFFKLSKQELLKELLSFTKECRLRFIDLPEYGQGNGLRLIDLAIINFNAELLQALFENVTFALTKEFFNFNYRVDKSIQGTFNNSLLIIPMRAIYGKVEKRLNILQILLKHGADSNSVYEVHIQKVLFLEHILFLALENPTPVFVECLLTNGAKPNISNSRGKNFLDCLIEKNWHHAVKLAIEKGASTNYIVQVGICRMKPIRHFLLLAYVIDQYYTFSQMKSFVETCLTAISSKEIPMILSSFNKFGQYIIDAALKYKSITNEEPSPELLKKISHDFVKTAQQLTKQHNMVVVNFLRAAQSYYMNAENPDQYLSYLLKVLNAGINAFIDLLYPIDEKINKLEIAETELFKKYIIKKFHKDIPANKLSAEQAETIDTLIEKEERRPIIKEIDNLGRLVQTNAKYLHSHSIFNAMNNNQRIEISDVKEEPRP